VEVWYLVKDENQFKLKREKMMKVQDN